MNARVRMALVGVLVGAVVGACTASPSLTEDRCTVEWNASSGPEALAAMLEESAPGDASIYFVRAEMNESGTSDCVLVALTETSALLGVLNDDGDVQVSSVPRPDGREMLELGAPVSVGSDGMIQAP